MFGGTLSLGVNVLSNRRGHISVNTYLIFISIQCLDPLTAAALSPPEKVQRSDQTSTKIVLSSILKVELLAMWKLFCRKEILLLTPMVLQSAFSEAFFSTYNATYSTVRSRALAWLVASTCVIVMNFPLSSFRDWQRLTVNARAIVEFSLFYAFEASHYVYAMVVRKQFKHLGKRPIFDWGDDGFGRAVCVYIFMRVGFNLMYGSLCRLVGTVNKNERGIIRLSATIRGIKSCGQAISYSIDSINQAQFPLLGVVAVNLSFFAVWIIQAHF